jgi:hypothetical protein
VCRITLQMSSFRTRSGKPQCPAFPGKPRGFRDPNRTRGARASPRAPSPAPQSSSRAARGRTCAGRICSGPAPTTRPSGRSRARWRRARGGCARASRRTVSKGRWSSPRSAPGRCRSIFWFGGMAAGSSFVALACDLAGDELSAATARGVALGALVPCPVVLIADLGRRPASATYCALSSRAPRCRWAPGA